MFIMVSASILLRDTPIGFGQSPSVPMETYWLVAVMTLRSGCGTFITVSASTSCWDIPMGFSQWLSVPMETCWPVAVEILRSGCGTLMNLGISILSRDTPIGFAQSPSVPMEKCWSVAVMTLRSGCGTLLNLSLGRAENPLIRIGNRSILKPQVMTVCSIDAVTFLRDTVVGSGQLPLVPMEKGWSLAVEMLR